MVEQINEDDKIIVVKMPQGDYKVMREMIKDRKSTNRFLNHFKTFSLAVSGIVAAYWFLGEKLIALLIHTPK